ncbi:type I restriction endonuclease subunit S [Bifidobacterium rousetti]|uniref:restriction endonuclease subunit S n=1 Tax=Bifidobacterium rousetti TaxID=2045439 RepID=UPI00123A045B|nr:restriction endonuclease subunit S [Bifidobacterium rousetti]KAA8820492.1 type I restriction endonuclease subunit S [Bifidobacterium rousetti]
MARIDASGWKDVLVSSIFRMTNTKSIPQKNIQPDSGEVSYVTAQSGNNGVMTCIDCPTTWIDDGNCIIIGGKTLTFSYQSKAFCSNDSHNIALYPLDGECVTEPCFLFLITALRASLSRKYTWGDSISITSIKQDRFKIPIDAEGDPDWAYMDAYMSEVMQESEASLENLMQTDDGKHTVDTSTWRPFKIEDLFDIKKGVRLTSADMRPGNIPFISAANVNNGITARISNNGHLHPAGTLTVAYNGNVGKTFYQDEPFWASDDVHVLYPKTKMSRGQMLFVGTCIERVGRQKYGFVDKWKLEYMRNDEIKLPVSIDGAPDWAYMDAYMHRIIVNASSDVKSLSTIL